MEVDDLNLEDRLSGVLLGTALGDALGLPAERLSAEAIRRRFGRLDRFRMLGGTGFVSDDTEQSALLAQSLARHPGDLDTCVRDFRRALLGWFLRLPWGVGLATIRASLRIGCRLRESGVPSAGNGAAMRAAILGAFFHDQPENRLTFGRALARVTHTDERAVDGALFVAELTARLLVHDPREAFQYARPVVREPQLGAALDRVVCLAAEKTAVADAARELGTSGFVVHTVPFAAFCLLRAGSNPLEALADTIAAGGDTDSIGAIVGAWLGARDGAAALPAQLISRIDDGPFGPAHLRALAMALADCRRGVRPKIPGYPAGAALARNLALYPVVLGHGFRRLLPF